MLRARRGTPADALVVGLGNPGEEYAGSRHNLGAEVVELLAERHHVRLRKGKERALVGETTFEGRRVTLAIPVTYVNESGLAVRPLVRRFGVTPEQLVVVHDELDLPFETVRLKRGGGEGGHNGLRSITRSTGTKDYLRVWVGIGRPPGRQDPADFVLKDFSSTERKQLDLLIGEAADATELLLTKGLEAAQNEVHPRS